MWALMAPNMMGLLVLLEWELVERSYVWKGPFCKIELHYVWKDTFHNVTNIKKQNKNMAGRWRLHGNTST